MPRLRQKSIDDISRIFGVVIEDWRNMRETPLDLYTWQWGHYHQLLIHEYRNIQKKLLDIDFCFARLTYVSHSLVHTLQELTIQVHANSTPPILDWFRFLRSRRHLIEVSRHPDITFLQVLLEGRKEVQPTVHRIQSEKNIEIWAMEQPHSLVDTLKINPLILNNNAFVDMCWLNQDIIVLLNDRSVQLIYFQTGQEICSWGEPCTYGLRVDDPCTLHNGILELHVRDGAKRSLQLPSSLQQLSITSSNFPPPQHIQDLPAGCEIPTSIHNFFSSSGYAQNYNGKTYQYGPYFFRTDTDGAIRFLDRKTGKNQTLLLGSLETDLVASYSNYLVFSVATQPNSMYVFDIEELFQLDDTVEGWTMTNGVMEPLEKSIGMVPEGLLIPDKNKVLVVSWNGVFGNTEQFEISCYARNEHNQFVFVNTATGYGWNPLTGFSVYSEDIISVIDELGHELVWYGIDRDDGLYKRYLFENLGVPTFNHYFEDFDEINCRAYPLDLQHELSNYGDELLISNLRTKEVCTWVTDREIVMTSFVTEDTIVVILDETPKLLRRHACTQHD